MKLLLDLRDCTVSSDAIKSSFKKLAPLIEKINNDSSNDLRYAMMHPINADYRKSIKQLAHDKKKLNISLLVIIGIGGSNLGTLAVQQALHGMFNNVKSDTLKVLYVDTIDPLYSNDTYNLIQQELEQKKRVLLNVITKSGTTTETLVNYALLLELLKKYYPHDYKDYIVITTDKNSPLALLARNEQYDCLEIPASIGGRYSVFTAVGLFPLMLMDCDIDQLLSGAQLMQHDCLSGNLEENYAAQTAAIMYEQYKKGFVIQDMFIFCVQFEAVGRWYRQLMGESIGKEFNVQGQKVNLGITPTISMGTVDLHSVGQLYLGGPYDKATTFVSLKNYEDDFTITLDDQLHKIAPQLQKKSMSQIMHATFQGVKQAYILGKRPFVSIELPECSAYVIGQLLQYKMIEIIYLAHLLGVNPFDQPNVELYKEETRKILK